MQKIEPFEKFPFQYENWFKENKNKKDIKINNNK